MLTKLAFSLLAAAVTSLAAVYVALAEDDIRTEQVTFAAGQTGAMISGTIVGRESVSYLLGAEAGQTMTVSLNSSHTAIYFNVYEPGRGPGDQALAVSELTPEINVFSGTLPITGVYTISVFLYRAAARRGERADYTLDVSISSLGDLSQPVQNDFADGLQGGPDFFEVQTPGSGSLNLRSNSSEGADIVTRLSSGTVVRNLGCRMAEGRRWCRVATPADPGFEGWAAGDFLIEGRDPAGGVATLPDMIPVPESPTDAFVPGTNFHATGEIPCALESDQSMRSSCPFGVKREGNGSALVTVFWPDGRSRTIFFEGGKATGSDVSQADYSGEFRAERESDLSLIRVGKERYEIPDIVVYGD